MEQYIEILLKTVVALLVFWWFPTPGEETDEPDDF